jgi:uncharacterized membrane protein
MSEINERNRASFEETAQELQDKLTIGQRVADSVAKFGGSWTFLIAFMFFIGTWIAINTLGFFHVIQFDKQPYVLLNLVLSTVAALQAPIIMMSQNRQADKDRANLQEDREINRQAELQIRDLKRQLNELNKSMEEEKRQRQEQTRTLLQEIRNTNKK